MSVLCIVGMSQRICGKIVVVVAGSYREDLDWKSWMRGEKRGYGSFYVFLERHGGEAKKKGGKCDFSSLLFLTFPSGFWVKVNLQNVGPVLPLLYSSKSDLSSPLDLHFGLVFLFIFRNLLKLNSNVA